MKSVFFILMKILRQETIFNAFRFSGKKSQSNLVFKFIIVVLLLNNGNVFSIWNVQLLYIHFNNEIMADF